MKKRMMKKNLKKNRDKQRKKNKGVNSAILTSTHVELHSHEVPKVKLAQIPIDATVVDEQEGWAVYLSQTTQSIYLKTTDYHPDPLRLTMESMQNFITLMKMHNK